MWTCRRGPCRNIDGQLLGSILRNKIRDKRFLRYEIASQININHGLNFVLKQMLVQRTDRIVTLPTPSEPVGTVQEGRLVDAFQYVMQHHLLHDLIFQDSDAPPA